MKMKPVLKKVFHSPFFLYFILLLIPFSIYFFRPDFAGVDTYGFLLLVCNGDNYAGLQGFQLGFFSLLPCNFFLLKALLFFCALVSGWFVLLLASLFSKEWGRMPWLLFFSPLAVLTFAQLENDQFAYPFLFASVYFFYRVMIGKRWHDLLVSLALLVPAGLFWQGSIFFLLAYSLDFWLLLVLSIPIVVFNWHSLLGVIVRTGIINEDLPFKFSQHLLLVFGVWPALFNHHLRLQTAFFFVLGMVSSKFWPLSLPFLGVGLLLGLEKLEEVVQKRWNSSIWPMVTIISICCIVGATQSIYWHEPGPITWEAIDFALSLDQNVANDFGLGYWILWKNGKTENYQSVWRETIPKPKQVFVTEAETSCEIIRRFGEVLKVARC